MAYLVSKFRSILVSAIQLPQRNGRKRMKSVRVSHAGVDKHCLAWPYPGRRTRHGQPGSRSSTSRHWFQWTATVGYLAS